MFPNEIKNRFLRKIRMVFNLIIGNLDAQIITDFAQLRHGEIRDSNQASLSCFLNGFKRPQLFGNAVKEAK